MATSFDLGKGRMCLGSTSARDGSEASRAGLFKTFARSPLGYLLFLFPVLAFLMLASMKLMDRDEMDIRQSIEAFDKAACHGDTRSLKDGLMTEKFTFTRYVNNKGMKVLADSPEKFLKSISDGNATDANLCKVKRAGLVTIIEDHVAFTDCETTYADGRSFETRLVLVHDKISWKVRNISEVLISRDQ
jgi:hypothetical protein